MQRESELSRFLWTLVLAVVIALVIASFAQHPLLGGNGQASGYQQQMTLWVASADPSQETERVVQQAANRWDTRTRIALAEVLPGGGSVADVASFLERVHGNPRDLLVVSSTTVADIAHDRAQGVASEVGLRARHAAAMLEHAPPIAVVCADPLLLAVPRDSPVRDLEAPPAAGSGSSPSTPLFSVANDTWETSNLAALVERYSLTGRIPYEVVSSARAAIVATTSGQASVVLAPRSEIRGELHSGRMRQLPWPRRQSAEPESWIAILGSIGLSRAQVRSLRAQARDLYGSSGWESVLRGDGLTPASVPQAALPHFVDANLDRAMALQNAAVRVVHDY
jgi:tripartite-type tricarboxylate transporter receptor subunit TctC